MSLEVFTVAASVLSLHVFVTGHLTCQRCGFSYDGFFFDAIGTWVKHVLWHEFGSAQ